MLGEPQRRHAVLRAQRIERTIPRITRGRLDAHTGFMRDFDMRCRERDATLTRECLAMRKPLICVRTKAVVNMQRDTARRSRDASHGVEQHTGVDTAAKRHRNARAFSQRRSCRLRGKRRADRLEYEAVGGRVSGIGHGDEARSAFD